MNIPCRLAPSMVVAALAALLTAFPLPTNAGHLRLEPNGTDDTAQLQAALRRCEGVNHSCEIRLAAGVFYTDVLLAKRFNGTIKGDGAHRTVIKPIEYRPLRSTPTVFIDEPTREQPYPILMHFADGGRIKMVDLSIEVPSGTRIMPFQLAENGSLSEPTDNALLAAVMVDGGANPAELRMGNVRIVGGVVPEAPMGSSLFNALRFEGQLRDDAGNDVSRKLQGGKLVIHRSQFLGAGLGVAIRDANNIDALVVASHFDSRLYGIWYTDLGDSRVSFIGNNIASELIGIGLTRAGRPPESASRALVALNRIVINENGTSMEGTGFDGIAVLDFFAEPESPSFNDDVEIYANNIALGQDVYDGIYIANDAQGHVRVHHNRITGTAIDAGLVGIAGIGTRFFQNDLGGLTAETLDVHLYPDTSNMRVRQIGADVLDEGTDNIVITAP